MAPAAPPVPPPAAPLMIPTSNKFKVLYDYEAGGDDEINLVEGELSIYILIIIVTVSNQDESGWWEGTNSKGETGLFPGNYVQKC